MLNNKKGISLIVLILIAVVVMIITTVTVVLVTNKRSDNINNMGEQVEKTKSNYISIETIEDFEKLLNGTYDLSKNYILMNDLDLKNYCKNNNCKPIGSDSNFGFSGIFDGNNHTISNYSLNVNDENMKNIGLFSKVSMGTIRNLKLNNAQITISAYNTNGTPIGILVGLAENSLIENCTVNGTIKTNGNIDKHFNNIGLLIGEVSTIDELNEGITDKIITTGYNDYHIISKIKNSFTKGIININSNSYINDIGGLIGKTTSSYHNKYGYAIFNSIENCSSNVDITIISTGDKYISSLGGLIGNSSSDYIYQSCSTGNINAENASYVAGFIGTSKTSMVEQCYSTGNVRGGFGSSGFISSYNNATGIELMGVSNSYSTGNVIIATKDSNVLPKGTWDSADCASFIYNADDKIENSYSTGNINFANSDITYGKAFIVKARTKLENNFYNSEILNYVNKDFDYVGLSSSAMLNKKSYTSFDFNNIWGINEGKSSPYLKWQNNN